MYPTTNKYHISALRKKTFDMNVFISCTVSIPQFYMILYTLNAPVVHLSIVSCFMSRKRLISFLQVVQNVIIEL